MLKQQCKCVEVEGESERAELKQNTEGKGVQNPTHQTDVGVETHLDVFPVELYPPGTYPQRKTPRQRCIRGDHLKRQFGLVHIQIWVVLKHSISSIPTQRLLFGILSMRQKLSNKKEWCVNVWTCGWYSQFYIHVNKSTQPYFFITLPCKNIKTLPEQFSIAVSFGYCHVALLFSS